MYHLILIHMINLLKTWQESPNPVNIRHTLSDQALLPLKVSTHSNNIILKSENVFSNLSSNSPPRMLYRKGQSLTLHCECAYLALENTPPKPVLQSLAPPSTISQWLPNKTCSSVFVLDDWLRALVEDLLKLYERHVRVFLFTFSLLLRPFFSATRDARVAQEIQSSKHRTL